MARKLCQLKAIRQSHLVMFSNFYDLIPKTCCVQEIYYIKWYLHKILYLPYTVCVYICGMLSMHMRILTYFCFPRRRVWRLLSSGFLRHLLNRAMMEATSTSVILLNFYQDYRVQQPRRHFLFTYFFQSKADRCWPIVALVTVNSQMFKMSTTSPNALLMMCNRVAYFLECCWWKTRRGSVYNFLGHLYCVCVCVCVCVSARACVL
jgi:hypothetical protein